METQIVYCDETGDDGNNTSSSDTFILTSLYMPASSWQDNFNIMYSVRQKLKTKYGFHTKQEMHTKIFLTDKGVYRAYNWIPQQKKEILRYFVWAVTQMDLSIVNVIIDKNNIIKNDYPILENALKYNIQRIDNTIGGSWNYLIITDEGRISPMRNTARKIRTYNPIQSQLPGTGYRNRPIRNLIEDILDKDSKESYFIQLCDFISYFVHLFYKVEYKSENLPNRIGRLIDPAFVKKVMESLKNSNKLNLKASKDPYGLVIYPKK